MGPRAWKQPRLAFLTASSWFFYAWWDWHYLPVLIARNLGRLRRRPVISSSTDERWRRMLLDHLARHEHRDPRLLQVRRVLLRVDERDRQRRWVWCSQLPSLHILLPIGISFYTFNSMSYTIDIFRRKVEPTRNLLEYTTFVSLFPHLIAGPIVRFTDLSEQLKRLTPRLTSEAGLARNVLPLVRPREEAADRRPASPLRLEAVHEPRPSRPAHRLGRRRRLFDRALLRLLRLLGHGRRPRGGCSGSASRRTSTRLSRR